MMSARRTTAAVVCAVALTPGCSLVGQPDVAAWDDDAHRAVTDATSEVATVRRT